MSRSSRRRRRAAVIESGVPEVVGRPFDDSDESFSILESDSPLEGVPYTRDSRLVTPPRPLQVLPKRSSGPGGWGRMPQAKPASGVRVRFQVRLLPRSVRSLSYKARLAANVLAIPFSKRARVCIARKIRREVLFATRKSGRNGGKVYRRTYESRYSC